MGGGRLRARGFLLAAAMGALAVLFLVAGCGSSSSGDDEVTVQTGSLSKAEFIEKADTICKEARSEFVSKYESFIKTRKSELGDKEKEEELLSEVLETILAPNVEGQIERISDLGAPKDYAPEAAAFLNALQTRVEEARDEPNELTASPFPFKKAENIAAKAGLKVCAESFG
jgi:hypothetical protein